jgi:hypothetical protein
VLKQDGIPLPYLGEWSVYVSKLQFFRCTCEASTINISVPYNSRGRNAWQEQKLKSRLLAGGILILFLG